MAERSGEFEAARPDTSSLIGQGIGAARVVKSITLGSLDIALRLALALAAPVLAQDRDSKPPRNE